MDHIKEFANQLLLDNKITALPISADDIIRILNKAHFTVLSFYQATDLIKQMRLEDSLTCDALTIRCAQIKAVLYRDHLPVGEKCFVLAHELGHILLGHISEGISTFHAADANITQETEADAFAYAFLAPTAVLRACFARRRDLACLTRLPLRRIEHVYFHLRDARMSPLDYEVQRAFSSYISHQRHLRFYRHRIALKTVMLGALCAVLCCLFPKNMAPFSAAGSKWTVTPLPSSSFYTLVGEDSTCYWCENGEVFHLYKDCFYLARSSSVITSTLQNCPKPRACTYCEKRWKKEAGRDMIQ